jgi:hypothetical protein
MHNNKILMDRYSLGHRRNPFINVKAIGFTIAFAIVGGLFLITG